MAAVAPSRRPNGRSRRRSTERDALTRVRTQRVFGRRQDFDLIVLGRRLLRYWRDESETRRRALVRAAALLLGWERSAVLQVPRRGVGRAVARRAASVRDVDPRRGSGRAVVDHDPQEARELSRGVRRL